MTRLHISLGAIAIALAVSSSTATAQCRSADSASTRMIHKWRLLMVSTDASTRQALSRNGLSQVDSSTVVLVTNQTTCTKAMKAYNTVLGAGANPPSGSVYVIKVGSNYIVRDPVQRGGEFAADVVLDSQFKIKAQLLG